MEKLVVTGGKRLSGSIAVSGSKNVALKVVIAALLTKEKVVVENVPHISDLAVLLDIVKDLGADVSFSDHTVTIQAEKLTDYEIPLEAGARIRTSSMLIAPLLARLKRALIPNPGGCRIGARPIDRTVDGLLKMGARARYVSQDGYFHAYTKGGLRGIRYRFEKNTHTGTETLIIASVLTAGRTILENAAQEPEVDELISLLNLMGAKIKRVARTIIIDGVKNLHGARFTIGPDRNEIITFAIAGILTGGDILISGIKKIGLTIFINKLILAGCGVEEKENGIRFYAKGKIKPQDITTSPYPGFMTDWQGPWAVFMTKAEGVSTIHETVYENRFNYIEELLKMGARISLFNRKVKNPETFYNFNLEDDRPYYFHAAKIYGPTPLHNAVVTISDLRAGATLVLAALAAKGKSVVFGVEHLDRGYERFEERLKSLGANVKRVREE